MSVYNTRSKRREMIQHNMPVEVHIMLDYNGRGNKVKVVNSPNDELKVEHVKMPEEYLKLEIIRKQPVVYRQNGGSFFKLLFMIGLIGLWVWLLNEENQQMLVKWGNEMYDFCREIYMNELKVVMFNVWKDTNIVVEQWGIVFMRYSMDYMDSVNTWLAGYAGVVYEMMSGYAGVVYEMMSGYAGAFHTWLTGYVAVVQQWLFHVCTLGYNMGLTGLALGYEYSKMGMYLGMEWMKSSAVHSYSWFMNIDWNALYTSIRY